MLLNWSKNREAYIDKEGSPILDEEFTSTLADFREWSKAQEKTLQDLFIKAK